ncbi:MAG: hypothetical protein HY866_11440 [Chloroflexi bacterium]|nr:hypothetical protein [Chloroflexota bacterium]
MEDFREILNYLGPGDELHWDIALYLLFLLNVVVILTVPEGNALATFLCIMVLVFIFIDKTYAFGFMLDPGRWTPKQCHTEIFVGTYLIRAAMFIAPFSIAGFVREGKSRGPAILAGIGAVVYSFMRWFMDQRNITAPEITCFNTEVMLQSVGIILILAKIALRDRLLLGTINRRVPGTVLRQPAAHEIEI